MYRQNWCVFFFFIFRVCTFFRRFFINFVTIHQKQKRSNLVIRWCVVVIEFSMVIIRNNIVLFFRDFFYEIPSTRLISSILYNKKWRRIWKLGGKQKEGRDILTNSKKLNLSHLNNSNQNCLLTWIEKVRRDSKNPKNLQIFQSEWRGGGWCFLSIVWDVC